MFGKSQAGSVVNVQVCATCRERGATVGVLCEGCGALLDGSIALAPQQLQPRTQGAGTAALIDVWGQPHLLDKSTPIGRADLPQGLVIVQPSVSRNHAVIEFETRWSVRDVGSTTGTFVNDRRVKTANLQHGDRVRFGDIEMFFVETPSPLPPRPEHLDTPTVRAPQKGTDPPPSKWALVTIELIVPRGGGGGLAVFDGTQVQLTTPQYELMTLLVKRMLADTGKPDELRGYVGMSELMKLSLDVPDPGEDHVRQLVRRVRRALIKAELGDLIEAKRGVGYRLRVVPRS
jgi:hypothetical protein